MGLTKTLTVGELRKALEGVPDDADVKVQEFEGGRSTATGCEYQRPDD